MKVDFIRPTIPPVTEVVITLTPKEWKDLQTVAKIPKNALESALKVNHITTWDVYGLMAKIAETTA